MSFFYNSFISQVKNSFRLLFLVIHYDYKGVSLMNGLRKYLSLLFEIMLALMIIYMVIWMIKHPVKYPYFLVIYPIYLFSILMMLLLVLIFNIIRRGKQKQEQLLSMLFDMMLYIYMIQSIFIYIYADHSDAPGVILVSLLIGLIIFIKPYFLRYKKYISIKVN